MTPVTGGICSYTLNLVLELAKGNDVAIICPGKSEEVLSSLERISESISEQVEIISTCNKPTTGSVFKTLEHQIGLAQALDRIERQFQPDVLHITAPHGYGFLRRSSIRIPMVTTVHSIISHDIAACQSAGTGFASLRPTDAAKAMLWPLLVANEIRVLRKSDAVITVSKSLVEPISRIAPHNRLFVVGNGVDTDFFFPAREKMKHIEDTRRILMVARLMPSKGIEHALTTCRLMVEDGQPVEFLFVGEGSANHYRRLAISQGIDKQCSFLGSIDYADMPDVYRMADIYCCTSIQESFPMTILEAMASGLPCISTRLGSIPDIIIDGTNGCLIDKRTPQEFADKITHLFSMPETLLEFGVAARAQVVSKHSSKLMARTTKAIYEELVGR